MHFHHAGERIRDRTSGERLPCATARVDAPSSREKASQTAHSARLPGKAALRDASRRDSGRASGSRSNARAGGGAEGDYPRFASPTRLLTPASHDGPRRRRDFFGRPSSSPSISTPFTPDDLAHLVRASDLAAGSDGLTQPHPKSGCVLVDPSGAVVAETFQMGQGGTRAEILAAHRADGAAAGASRTSTSNPSTALSSARTPPSPPSSTRGYVASVIAVQHPVAGVRGEAVRALRDAAILVHVLDDEALGGGTRTADEDECLATCRARNRALLYRCATGRPFGVFKYAMTLDGKIATTSGHSAWVTGPTARAEVWAERAKSDAIIVGGRTVRRDNPNLTTRREGGHRPARIVLSRTMDLPGLEDDNPGLGTGDEGDAWDGTGAPRARTKTNLWDTSDAPTIVMTTKGARPHFQAQLRGLGVEIIEFDELTPDAVSAYCAERGFLQLFWECGGLAAPALRDGVIHHVMAFVAPKIIGNAGAPRQPRWVIRDSSR